MLHNPSHEVKLKIYNFSLDILEYKKLIEKLNDVEKAMEIQDQELDKIFKKHFEDTEKDRDLFNGLVSRALFAFMHRKTIDVDAIKKELEHDRKNNLN